jgi:hypothetical protein
MPDPSSSVTADDWAGKTTREVPMPKMSETQRAPERDYSHRSLLDKLGVKPENRVSVLGVSDDSFLKELSARSRDVSFDEMPKEPDLVFLGIEERDDLARLKSLARAIKGPGAIWAVYPKGRQHIRGVDVISAGKAAGLVDNKVVRFSESHTALRFVIPLGRR